MQLHWNKTSSSTTVEEYEYEIACVEYMIFMIYNASPMAAYDSRAKRSIHEQCQMRLTTLQRRLGRLLYPVCPTCKQKTPPPTLRNI